MRMSGLSDLFSEADLIEALQAAPISNRLRNQAQWPAAPASSELPPTDVHLVSPPLAGWHPPQGANQSTVQARYRLGGEGSLGTTALAEVRMPRASLSGVTFILDMGFSLSIKLHLMTIAELLRDGAGCRHCALAAGDCGHLAG